VSEPAAATAIRTRGLSRAFGDKWAVRDLDLEIAAGEVYGFLGQNGAGKTTTLRLLTGLLEPTRGEATIEGMTHREHGAVLRRRIGFVPDTPPLYDYLTGRQYVALVASLWGVDRRTRDERGDRLLHALSLHDAADELCKGYSHGMRKKAHLAAVLTTQPSVLLLDEPTTGLDPASTRRLKDLLRDEASRGTTVFLSTHVLDVAEQLCGRVGVIAGGRLLAEGSPRDLVARHGGTTLEDAFLALTADAPPAAGS
jgi:ABC-2 type transport system ATP-binding protein